MSCQSAPDQLSQRLLYDRLAVLQLRKMRGRPFVTAIIALLKPSPHYSFFF
ncbi:unnamed protein product [Staurois parvus]|uniref:Uncharacterized protein n=1 Tax=Staurois parvus TaxID=386267 RepID=A0ABN9E4J4_9NEOB|nr:unnamed protein product [Staurois parvus]